MTKKSLQLAVTNIPKFGDTDIFPYPVENHAFHDQPDLVVKALEELHEQFSNQLTTNGPDNINTLAPVGYTGFRWASQIDPIWNAYYLALVIQLGDAIEAKRIPISADSVFSYRFKPNEEDGRIFDTDIGWKRFIEVSLNESKKITTNSEGKEVDLHKFVIVCDIADFYSRIYHHRIENALRWLNTKGDETKRIVNLLQTFSNTVSYGLPVGGPASRLLAELSLNSVDQYLRSKQIRFCRFVDDYHIFCESKEAAYQTLIFLSDKLFNEGLSLQKTKTRILTLKEFQEESKFYRAKLETETNELTPEERLLRISLHYDPYSDTSVIDYEKLKSEVAKIDVIAILGRELGKTRIDPVVTKQAISALKVVEPQSRNEYLRTLLSVDNLNLVAPVIGNLFIVLRSIYSELDGDTQATVDSSLITLIRIESHIAQVDLNLGYIIQILRKQHTHEKESLFVELYDKRTSPLIRREVILSMADWGCNYWLTDLKKRFNGLSKWERRAFIIASYRLADEGRHWRDHTKASFDISEKLIRDWFGQRYQKNQTIPQ